MREWILDVLRLFILGIALLSLLPAVTASVPLAGFVSNVTSGTIPLDVRFTDMSTNVPTEWIWSFGDGGTSSAQNPLHTYTRAGSYTVTLASTNAGGSNTVTMTEYITASRPVIAPAASFVSNVTSGPVPLAVQFLDTSTNSPTSAVWAFGDGSTFVGPAPSHTYINAGLYTVTLTSTNTAGSNTVSRIGYISVSPPVTDVPVAGFVSTANSGTVPQTVQFIDASTNFPVAWAWLFGDGEGSTLQNPLHTYTRIGSYNVTLTATNAWGNHTVTRDNYISVGSAVPVASFVSSATSGTPPLSVQFTDTSTNLPTSWNWEFGDGRVSAIQNPACVYAVPGTYTVTFSAMNAAGRGTIIRNNYITVTSSSPPVAAFASDIREGSAPLFVQFYDRSSGIPTSWAWSFGDGTVSAIKNPSHIYQGRGPYTVSLAAANDGGSNTSTLTDYIRVSERYDSTAERTVRQTAVPASPSATPSSAAGAAGVAGVTPVPNPVFSLSDLSSGIPLLALLLLLLGIVAGLLLWWILWRKRGSGRQRGRDL